MQPAGVLRLMHGLAPLAPSRRGCLHQRECNVWLVLRRQAGALPALTGGSAGGPGSSSAFRRLQPRLQPRGPPGSHAQLPSPGSAGPRPHASGRQGLSRTQLTWTQTQRQRLPSPGSAGPWPGASRLLPPGGRTQTLRTRSRLASGAGRRPGQTPRTGPQQRLQQCARQRQRPRPKLSRPQTRSRRGRRLGRLQGRLARGPGRPPPQRRLAHWARRRLQALARQVVTSLRHRVPAREHAARPSMPRARAARPGWPWATCPQTRTLAEGMRTRACARCALLGHGPAVSKTASNSTTAKFWASAPGCPTARRAAGPAPALPSARSLQAPAGFAALSARPRRLRGHEAAPGLPRQRAG